MLINWLFCVIRVAFFICWTVPECVLAHRPTTCTRSRRHPLRSSASDASFPHFISCPPRLLEFFADARPARALRPLPPGGAGQSGGGAALKVAFLSGGAAAVDLQRGSPFVLPRRGTCGRAAPRRAGRRSRLMRRRRFGAGGRAWGRARGCSLERGLR